MYQFKSFRFDPLNGELRSGKKILPLRPKSVLLLEHLLAHPGQIHPKQELMQEVWHRDWVDDQALFQLISEIRSVLGDKGCIATYPNRGYRWGWGVHQESAPLLLGWLAPALAAMLLVAAGIVAFWPRQSVSPDSQLMVGMSPAMNAVTQAMQARSEGDLERGIELLEVAVQANPHFAAAKVELADALWVKGELQRAQGYAHDALSDSRIVGDHYLEATAYVLLSKLRMSQGDLSGALRANAEAARIADDHGHVCAAQVSARWQQQLSRALIATDDPLVVEHSSSVAACEAALIVPQSHWLADFGTAELKG